MHYDVVQWPGQDKKISDGRTTTEICGCGYSFPCQIIPHKKAQASGLELTAALANGGTLKKSPLFCPNTKMEDGYLRLLQLSAAAGQLVLILLGVCLCT